MSTRNFLSSPDMSSILLEGAASRGSQKGSKSFSDNAGKNTQTQRQKKVGEQIRRILCEILGRADFHDATLSSTYVSLSSVRVSPDLRHATCFVQEPLGQDVKVLVKALNEHAPKLRHLLSSEVHFKYLPKLKFVVDTEFMEAQRLDRLFRSTHVQQDLGQKTPSQDQDDEQES